MIIYGQVKELRPDGLSVVIKNTDNNHTATFEFERDTSGLWITPPYGLHKRLAKAEDVQLVDEFHNVKEGQCISNNVKAKLRSYELSALCASASFDPFCPGSEPTIPKPALVLE